MRALASVDGHFYLWNHAGRGWVYGRWDGMPVLLRPAGREAIRLAARDGYGLALLAMGDTRVAGVSWNDEHESDVRVYSIE